MNVPIIAFFNNKGGVGKTSLVYHLSWMFADQGRRVLAADLDPQANLSAAFLTDDRLEKIWGEEEIPHTVYDAIKPIKDGLGDVAVPEPQLISRDPNFEPAEDFQADLFLLPGDLQLSAFEDDLSTQWALCLDKQPRAFRVTSAFWRLLQGAARKHACELILVDIGPNLGAINRAALISADHVVFPLSPDLFSLQGLRNLGPTLKSWREEWRERRQRNPVDGLELPSGGIHPLGYIILQHNVRLDRPVKAYERWASRIPGEYRDSILHQPEANPPESSAQDPYCLAMLKHFRSLMPMAQDARKPIFFLKAADGAIGAHAQGVQSAYQAFSKMADEIISRIPSLATEERL